jgi:hypothetical protein
MTRRSRRLTEGEEYLRQYPDLERWMNRCSLCGSIGHKPELPQNIYPHFSVAADNLRRLFAPLAVDDLSRCEVCSSALEAVR